MSVDCESILSAMERNALSDVYTRECPYVLGGDGCNVDLESYASSGTASSVVGPVVTAAFTSGLANLAWGTLKAPDGSQQMILTHEGTVLTLMWPLKSLVSGMTVTVYPGCDRSIKMCRDVYSNLGCYGGCPGIPGEANNPMKSYFPVMLK
jgi:uncharacterized phage protein (TIGR02218 family)